MQFTAKILSRVNYEICRLALDLFGQRTPPPHHHFVVATAAVLSFLVWFPNESGSSQATYLNKDEALFYRPRFHFGRKCHVGRSIRIAMRGTISFSSTAAAAVLYLVQWVQCRGKKVTYVHKYAVRSRQCTIVSVLLSPAAAAILRPTDIYMWRQWTSSDEIDREADREGGRPTKEAVRQSLV